MLHVAYYAQNYAGIIRQGLFPEQAYHNHKYGTYPLWYWATLGWSDWALHRSFTNSVMTEVLTGCFPLAGLISTFYTPLVPSTCWWYWHCKFPSVKNVYPYMVLLEASLISVQWIYLTWSTEYHCHGNRPSSLIIETGGTKWSLVHGSGY